MSGTIRQLTEPKYTQKIHSDERAAGVRAAFHVYWTSRGKTYFDPAYTNNQADAITQVVGLARKLGHRDARAVSIAAVVGKL